MFARGSIKVNEEEIPGVVFWNFARAVKVDM